MPPETQLLRTLTMFGKGYLVAMTKEKTILKMMKNEVENNFFREKPKLLVQLKSATTFGAISSSPIILD